MLIDNAITRTALFVEENPDEYIILCDPTNEEKLHFNLKEEYKNGRTLYFTDLDSIKKVGKIINVYSKEEDEDYIICAYKYVINKPR